MFCFLLAITEVNDFLVQRWFIWGRDNALTYLDFCRALSWDLINNPMLSEEEEKITYNLWRQKSENELVKAPPHAKSFNGQRWKCTAKIQCKGTSDRKCHKGICTYCSCSVGVWMCQDCYVVHFAYCRENDD